MNLASKSPINNFLLFLKNNNYNCINDILKYVKKSNFYNYKTNNDKTLYIIYKNWYNKLNITILDDYLMNYVIMDNHLNIYFYDNEIIYDSLRDGFSLDDILNLYQGKNIDSYISYESTKINIFYKKDEEKWYYCTRKNINIDFNDNHTMTYGNMFDDIINRKELEKYLNIENKYSFLLSHKNNSHLLNNENKLILLRIYDNNFQIINNNEELLKLPNIILPEAIKIEDFKKINELSIEGIILKINNTLFKIYHENYNVIYQNNPKFKTIQEELICRYVANQIDKNDYNYYLTKDVIFYINILTCNLVNFFTEYKPTGNTKFIKKNNNFYYMIEKYNIIKKILYDLQTLIYKQNFTKMTKNILENYLTNSSNKKIIWILYNIYINDNQLFNLIKYNNEKLLDKFNTFGLLFT